MENVILFIRHNLGVCALDKSLLAAAIALAVVVATQAAGFVLSALYNLLHTAG